jgi:hypothetical protein
VPFYITWGGQESDNIQEWGRAMAAAVEDSGQRMRVDVFPEDDHFQIHLKTRFPDNTWTRVVHDWMAGGV